MRVPQRSDCASDSLTNGLAIDISAPSPALTIHADPINNPPAPDSVIKEGEGGEEFRRHSDPKTVSKKEHKIIRDLRELPSRIPRWQPHEFSLHRVRPGSLLQMHTWGFLAPPFWSTMFQMHKLGILVPDINRCPRRWLGTKGIFVLLIRIIITTLIRVCIALDSSSHSVHIPSCKRRFLRSSSEQSWCSRDCSEPQQSHQRLFSGPATLEVVKKALRSQSTRIPNPATKRVLNPESAAKSHVLHFTCCMVLNKSFPCQLATLGKPLKITGGLIVTSVKMGAPA